MASASSKRNAPYGDPDEIEQDSQDIGMEEQPAHTAMSKKAVDGHTSVDSFLKISSNTVARPLTSHDPDLHKSLHSDQHKNSDPVPGTVQISSRCPAGNEKENTTTFDNSSSLALGNKTGEERSANNVSLSEDSETESQENEDTGADSGEVTSSHTSDVSKSPEQAFLRHLGLRKVDRRQKEADIHVKSVGDVSAKGSSVGEMDKQQPCKSALDVDRTEVSSDQSLLSKQSSVEQPGSNLSMIKSLKVIKPDNGNAKGNKTATDSEAHESSNGDQDAGSAKKEPVCIKVRLEENDVTIICCPVALLLQHKGCVDVSLRENDPDAYFIKCRKCGHEVTDPYAMLQHLKAEHRIQGCLQKLLNLNSQHLGCMSRPVCVNVPGVLTLPERLDDMEQGVIRFNSSGVPRLSFVCRLCPLNFHTARGLSAHHQYFMRNLFTRDQPVSHKSKWACKLCPLQFASFQSYYAHNKWMRVTKDLFVNTDAVNKKTKKFEVIDVSGKVVASLEVPKAHNLAVKTWPEEDLDIGWGYKASPQRLALNRLMHRNPEKFVRVPDVTSQTQTIDSATANTIPEPKGQESSKQLTEDKMEKKKAPSLYRTLDKLCRKLAERVDPSADTKTNSAGDQEDDEHEYMCAICHKTFPRLAQMQGHMGSHVRRHRVITQPNTAATSVFDPPYIEQQSATAPKGVVYKCGICNEVFPKLDEMQAHMESHNRLHPATNTPMKSLDTPFSETVQLMSFTCDLCHWSCSSERKFWDHRRTHDNQNKSEDDSTSIQGAESTSGSSSNVQKKTMYVCYVCNKSFTREINLKFHMKKHKQDSQDQSGDEQEITDEVAEPEQQYICSTCGRSFLTSRQLTSHKTWHTKIRNRTDSPPAAKKDNPGSPKRYYACNMCNKLCNSIWGLGLHKKKHLRSPKLRKCRVSSSEELEKVKRKSAERTNPEQKSSGVKAKGNPPKLKIQAPEFLCKYCEQRFSSCRLFTNHMTSHTNNNTSKSEEVAGSALSKKGYSKLDEVSKQTPKEGEVSTSKDGNGSSSSKDSTNVKPVPRHNNAELLGRASSQGKENGDLTDGTDAEPDTNQSSRLKVNGDAQENDKASTQVIEEKQQVNVNNAGETAGSHTDSNRNESSEASHSTEMDISHPEISTVPKEIGNKVASDTGDKFVGQVSNVGKTTETDVHKPSRQAADFGQATMKTTEPINTVQDVDGLIVNSLSKTELDPVMASTTDGKSMQTTEPKAKKDISVDVTTAASHGVSATCEDTSSNDTNQDCKNKKAVPSESKEISSESKEIFSQTQLAAPSSKKTHSLEESPGQVPVPPSPFPTTELEEKPDILAKTSEASAQSMDVSEQMRSSRDGNCDETIEHPGHEVGVPESNKVASESSVELTRDRACNEKSETNVEVMEVSAPQNQNTPRSDVCASSDEALVEEGHQKMMNENDALSQKASKIPQIQETGDITSDAKELSRKAGQISSAELVRQSGKAQLQTAEVSPNGEDTQTNMLSVECVSFDLLINDADKKVTPNVLCEPPPETKSVPQEKDSAFAQAVCEQASSSNNQKTETVNQEVKPNKEHYQNSEVLDNACAIDDEDCHSDCSMPAIDERLGEESDEPLFEGGGSSRNLASRVRFSCEICNKTFNKKFQLRGHKGKHGKNGEILPRIVVTSKDIESGKVEDMIAPNVGTGVGECHQTQPGVGELSQLQDEQNSMQKPSGAVYAANMPTQDGTTRDVKRRCTSCDHTPSEMQSTNSTSAESQDDVTTTEAPSDKNRSDTPTTLKTLKCPYCKKTFAHVNQLNAHKKFHSYIKAKKTRLHKKSNMGKKPHTCDICSKTFKDYKGLSCHKRVHVPRELMDSKKSAESGDKESRASQLEAPSTRAKSGVLKPRLTKKLPMQQGNFICKFCNKAFYHLIRFKEHLMTTHPTAKTKFCFLKPFVCEVCGKAFSKPNQRTYHMKVHAPGRCQNIKKKISLQESDHSYYKKPPTAKTKKVSAEPGEKQKQDLIQASNDRASVLEYKCQLCQTFFKSQNQLAGHMNLHRKYTCQVCDVSFALARQLWGHLKIHGGLRKGLIDSGKQSASPGVPGMTSRPVTRHLTTSNSNALLKKIIRMYLFGAKPRKTGFNKCLSSNGFKPKRTLQRALLKHSQTRMQKIFGVLRKSVVLEIDADSHKLVYDCKECHKISVSHKAILRHFLAKHLDETKKPVASGAEKGEKTLVTDQRFRNKSKVGCPVCKSSGFQCHLHNNDDFTEAKSQGHFRDDSPKSSKSDASHVSIKLFQDDLRFPKHTPNYRFKCSLCPFTSKSEAGLDSHQTFHRDKSWKQLAGGVPPGKRSLGCPWCSFKAKNVYALAAHSRVHRVKVKGKKVLLGNAETNTPSLGQTQSLARTAGHPMPKTSLSPSSNTKTLSDGAPQQQHAYICCICSKCFPSSGTYQAHLKKHTESFPFKCSQCPCRFPSADELHKHIMVIHSAKNPYRCTECPFSSANRESLQSHLVMHSGAKVKKDRKADWSAYLSQVLQTRVAPTEAAQSDEGLDTAQSMAENLPYHVVGALSSDGSLTSSPKSGEPLAKHFGAESDADLKNPEQLMQTEESLNRLSDSPSEYFACSQCKDFQASRKQEWDKHMTIVHKKTSKSKLKCSMCRYKTTSEEHLEQHMKHHSHETLQCNSCTYSTPHKHLVIRHVQTVHRQHRPFKCNQCSYSTAYRHHLKRHSEKHEDPNFRCRYRKFMQKGDWHSAEVSSTGNTHMICRECGKQLQNKKTLRSHYIRVHGKRLTDFPVARWEEDISTSSDANSEQKEQPTFTVIQPNEATPNENMFECTVCSYIFKSRSELNRHFVEGHLETRSSIPCQCPQCGLVTGSGQLEAHMLIHEEENLLQCPEDGCNFKTAKSIHLDRHRIKHHAQRKTQMQCHFCQATFPDSSSLRMHNIQNHSDQASSINARSPFKCPQCPYISTNQKDASRHFSLHNYILAFKCEYCIFSTSTAAAIATHRKIHRHPRSSLPSTPTSNSPSQSPRVKSNSPSKSADVQDSPGAMLRLPKHIFVTESGKKLYECRYCQRFFDVAEAWQRHELRHRIEWPPY